MLRYIAPVILFAILMLFIFDGISRNAKLESYQSVRREELLIQEILHKMKNNHMVQGRAIALDGTTSSESQSYALLMAVFSNDKKLFDETWFWTREHLQIRADHLFAWRWSNGKIDDSNSATDADQDIALALYLASVRWNVPEYEVESREIVEDIWAFDTKLFLGKRYVIGGAEGFASAKDIVMNPSYFSPYAYRIFSKIDKRHNWLSLVDSSYEILNRCVASSGLFPDWCKLDSSGKIIRKFTLGEKRADLDSYDAMRVPYRLALDYVLFKEPRAKILLEKNKIFAEELLEKDKISAAYELNGEASGDDENYARYGAELARSLSLDSEMMVDILDKKIRKINLATRDNTYELSWIYFGLHAYTKGWGFNEIIEIYID